MKNLLLSHWRAKFLVVLFFAPGVVAIYLAGFGPDDPAYYGTFRPWVLQGLANYGMASISIFAAFEFVIPRTAHTKTLLEDELFLWIYGAAFAISFLVAYVQASCKLHPFWGCFPLPPVI